MMPLLKIWIIFAMGWLVGVACAIEVGKELAGKPARKLAQVVSGLLVVAIATTAAAGAGLGLFYVIVWAVSL